MDDSACQTPHLPLELYRPIFEELHFQSDFPTLSSAALVCRSLRYEAQSWLFRGPMGLGPVAAGHLGIALSDRGAGYFKRVKDSRLHVKFLMTIVSSSNARKRLWSSCCSIYANPHLARYVKSYAIDSIVEYQENPLWSLLLAALPMMVNLKSLTFRAFGGHPAAKELLAGCTFQLTYLDWGSHSDEAGIGAFLLGQRELRHVSLHCDSLLDINSHQPHTSPSHSDRLSATGCIQKLASVEGSRAVIESLLPTRNVTSLSWVPHLDDALSAPVDHLSEELGKLKCLSFGGYFARPHFRLVAPYLKSVEVLELVGLHDLDELNCLASLPALRELIISLQWGSSRLPVPTNPTVRAEIIASLFKGSKKLERVDVVYEWRKQNEIWYQKWMKPMTGSSTMEASVLKREDVKKGRF
ncbi:hypothetical protein CVT24_011181 [Panaeolus cyanescens]|uniref:F-box domain-containing protein n=1 Tax=Panaeolus cyanescens TaxID=181874 RepID=A0A409YG89_9AGAR|nr:hypothetical protein CVT24_011181 [Panaeolus cyanescens]